MSTIYRYSSGRDVVIPKRIKGRARRLPRDFRHGYSPTLVCIPCLLWNAPLRVRVMKTYTQEKRPSPPRPLLRTWC